MWKNTKFSLELGDIFLQTAYPERKSHARNESALEKTSNSVLELWDIFHPPLYPDRKSYALWRKNLRFLLQGFPWFPVKMSQRRCLSLPFKRGLNTSFFILFSQYLKMSCLCTILILKNFCYNKIAALDLAEGGISYVLS